MKRHFRAVVLAAVVGAVGFAVPLAARAYLDRARARRAAWFAAAAEALRRGEETLPPLPEGFEMRHEGDAGALDRDDPVLRRLVRLFARGPGASGYEPDLLAIRAAEERKRVAQVREAMRTAAAGPAPRSPTPPMMRPWTSLGPAGARSEYNGGAFQAVDAGRVTALRQHPVDPNVVYAAFAGGGLWRTGDFLSGAPTWEPLGGALGVLAIGALELDPSNPDVVYVGTGDAFAPPDGGSVLRSDDGGRTFGPPTLLTGTHPLDTGTGPTTLTATSVRKLAVDPTSPAVVLAATDVGLFRSGDRGATFSLVDLPNTSPYLATTGPAVGLESVWDVAYLGQVGGVSRWLASGVYACPQPTATLLIDTGDLPCPNGGPPEGVIGDLWRSVDGGATWVSTRAAGLLPTQAPSWGSGSSAGLGDLGRIALGVGTTSSPGSTAVYAQASNVGWGQGGQSVVLFASRDGAATWSLLATPSTTNLSNPTLSGDCKTLDLAHGQSWYDLAVAVDPTDADHALMGGDLCGARSLDGGATWQLVAHWLPVQGLNATASGSLPYVHADWQTAIVGQGTGGPLVIGGGDGGIFTSEDVFRAADPSTVTWSLPNAGLVTHLTAGLASGDFASGTPDLVLAGFQDDGTRLARIGPGRRAAQDLGIYDQVVGGDGYGLALAADAGGGSLALWSSAGGSLAFCPVARDCSQGPSWTWVTLPLTVPGDTAPFCARMAALGDPAGAVAIASTRQLFAVSVVAGRPRFRPLTPAAGIIAGGQPRDINVAQESHTKPVRVAPFPYVVDGVPVRAIGLALTGGNVAVVTDDGVSPATTVAAAPVHVAGEQLRGLGSVALPRDPAHLGGTDIRRTYLVTSVAIYSIDAATQVLGRVSDAMGHVLYTADGGLTWVPLHGNGTPSPGGGTMDLPNVRAHSAVFDPGDPTDRTVLVSTDAGLYRTTDLGLTWARFGDLPAAPVSEIAVSRNGSLVRAALYGRGVWQLEPNDAAGAAPSTADWNRDGLVDFLDAAALAARLGATPSAPGAVRPILAPPGYDATLDLDGDGVMGESDLAALLARVGGAP